MLFWLICTIFVLLTFDWFWRRRKLPKNWIENPWTNFTESFRTLRVLVTPLPSTTVSSTKQLSTEFIPVHCAVPPIFLCSGRRCYPMNPLTLGWFWFVGRWKTQTKIWVTKTGLLKVNNSVTFFWCFLTAQFSNRNSIEIFYLKFKRECPLFTHNNVCKATCFTLALCVNYAFLNFTFYLPSTSSYIPKSESKIIYWSKNAISKRKAIKLRLDVISARAVF